MNKEEELFKKRILELAQLADKRYKVAYTDFMNLNELNIFHSTLQKSYFSYKLSGGYEMAERQMAVFLPDAFYYEENFPIICIRVTPLNKKFSDVLNHRDYLGAILNLGIDRSKIGDILVKEEAGYIFCQDTMADFICSELTRIKHTSVSAKVTEAKGLSIEPKVQEIKGTVSSVRLDSTMSLAFSTSRSKLTALIEGGKVFVNGRLITTNAYNLKESDIVSVRGMGRFSYQGMLSTTKKGRIFILIHKYV